MVVKSGPGVRAEEEARVNEFLREKGIKEVPKIYGTYTATNNDYLILEYLEGAELDAVWFSLSSDDQSALRTEIAAFVSRLRSIPRTSPDTLIGNFTLPLSRASPTNPNSVCGAISPFLPLPPNYRPPSTSASFTTLVKAWYLCGYAETGRVDGAQVWQSDIEPFLDGEAPVVFTHDDLHGGNVLVARDAEQGWRVVGVVDWEFAGWYPAWVEGHLGVEN
ncbi:hypothetical protein JCM6882_003382 [Rhodosporidiobolus microsporus]